MLVTNSVTNLKTKSQNLSNQYFKFSQILTWILFGLVGFALVWSIWFGQSGLVWSICYLWFNKLLFGLVHFGLFSLVWSSFVHLVHSGFFRSCFVCFGERNLLQSFKNGFWSNFHSRPTVSQDGFAVLVLSYKCWPTQRHTSIVLKFIDPSI